MDNATLPNTKDRLTVVGQTGSGKTHGALWHLSKFDLKNQRWIIFNFKNEELINSIPMIREIGYEIPSKPGLYIVRPSINDEERLTEFLWSIWAANNVGCFFDEGYMIEFIGAVKPYIAILTQGRTKHIPVITLIQRPVGVTRFAFSEAQYIQVFDLMDFRDYEVTENYMPSVYELNLPEFHSWYWEVKRKKLVQFSPVPNIDEIFSTIKGKLHSRKI